MKLLDSEKKKGVVQLQHIEVESQVNAIELKKRKQDMKSES